MKMLPARMSLSARRTASTSSPTPSAGLSAAGRRIAPPRLGFPGSARGHAGGLDDRRPELDLVAEVLRVRLGRRAVLRDRSGAEIGQAVDHVLILQRDLERGIQRFDDLRRRSGRHIETVPDRYTDVAHAGL